MAHLPTGGDGSKLGTDVKDIQAGNHSDPRGYRGRREQSL